MEAEIYNDVWKENMYHNKTCIASYFILERLKHIKQHENEQYNWNVQGVQGKNFTWIFEQGG